MASTMFVLALLVLTKLSANNALPTSGTSTSGPKANHDWPKECEDRTYCWIKTAAYDNLKETFEKLLRDEEGHHIVGDETGRRQSLAPDVARCDLRRTPNALLNITMIRDEKNITWYVPQTKNFTVLIEVSGCTDTNRIVTPLASDLDQKQLNDRKVHCVEQIMHFKFPVLSQDQTKIESEALAPYKGLPMHCSAKILRGS